MLVDKSNWTYGAFYSRVEDPMLAKIRQVVMDLIPEGSSILDIACGTGLLCRQLRQQKHCRVTGIDLSVRMIEFARQNNLLPEVTFIHGDATDLRDFADQSFDYATLLLIVHELTRTDQLRVLKEALRVARRCILLDAASPLPRNLVGLEIHLAERVLGRGHLGNFKDYVAGGGISGMLKDLDLPTAIEHSSVFMQKCRQVVVLSIQQ